MKALTKVGIYGFLLRIQQPFQPYAMISFRNGDSFGMMLPGTMQMGSALNKVRCYGDKQTAPSVVMKGMSEIATFLMRNQNNDQKGEWDFSFHCTPTIEQSVECKADEARIVKDSQLQNMTIAPAGYGKPRSAALAKEYPTIFFGEASNYKYIIGTDWCKPGYDDYHAAIVAKVTETGEGVILEVITERDPKAFEKALEALKAKYQPNTTLK